MKTLLTIKDSDLFPGISENEKVPSRHREAARAVVFDDDNKIAILNVTKKHFHKLPGGGLEQGEDIDTALAREVIEETGCKVEVETEIGEIIEYRMNYDLMQISHIYKARLIGEKGSPEFVADEIEDEFKLEWMTLEEAIKTLETDQTDDYEGKFILKRDLAALKEIED